MIKQQVTHASREGCFITFMAAVSVSQSCFRHTQGVALSAYLYYVRGIYVQLGTLQASCQGHFSLSSKLLRRYQNDLNHC